MYSLPDLTYSCCITAVVFKTCTKTSAHNQIISATESVEKGCYREIAAILVVSKSFHLFKKMNHIQNPLNAKRNRYTF